MMQHFKFRNLVQVIIFTLILLVSTSLVLGLVPEQYWGYVSIDGLLYNSTGNVSVHSLDGDLIAYTNVPNDESHPGSYQLYIPFKDQYDANSNGAYTNEPLVWKVNGISVISPTRGSDRAEPGKVNNVFNLSAIKNPLLDTSLTVADQSYLGNDFLISGILKNTGEGDAQADISLESDGDDLLLSGSPSEFDLVRNSSIAYNYVTSFDSCGEHELNFTINAHNYAGDLLDALSYTLPVNVVGPDLSLDNVSYKLLNESTLYFTLYISSNSNFITGFEKVKIYYNGIFFKEISYNLAIDANDFGIVEFPLKFDKPLQYGDDFELRIVSLDTLECNKENNKFIATLSDIPVTDPLRNGYGLLDDLNFSVQAPQAIESLDGHDNNTVPTSSVVLSNKNATSVSKNFDFLVLFLMIILFFILVLLMFTIGRRILLGNENRRSKKYKHNKKVVQEKQPTALISPKKKPILTTESNNKNLVPPPTKKKTTSLNRKVNLFLGFLKFSSTHNTPKESSIDTNKKISSNSFSQSKNSYSDKKRIHFSKGFSFIRAIGSSKNIPQDKINALLKKQAPKHISLSSHEIVPGVVIDNNSSHRHNRDNNESESQVINNSKSFEPINSSNSISSINTNESNNACVESNVDGNLSYNDTISSSSSSSVLEDNNLQSDNAVDALINSSTLIPKSAIPEIDTAGKHSSGVVESVLEKIYSGDKISAVDEDSISLDSTDMLLDSEIFSSDIFSPIRNNLRFPANVLSQAKNIVQELLSADDPDEYSMYLKSLQEDESINPTLVKIINNALLESDNVIPLNLESSKLGTSISYPQMVQYIAFLRSEN